MILSVGSFEGGVARGKEHVKIEGGKEVEERLRVVEVVVSEQMGVGRILPGWCGWCPWYEGGRGHKYSRRG